jgi:hypothetical protein
MVARYCNNNILFALKWITRETREDTNLPGECITTIKLEKKGGFNGVVGQL